MRKFSPDLVGPSCTPPSLSVAAVGLNQIIKLPDYTISDRNPGAGKWGSSHLPQAGHKVALNWTNLFAGVDHATGANQGYASDNVNLLRIDLTLPQIEIFTTPRASLEPSGVKTTTFLTEQFDPSEMLAMFAVNANYFDMEARSIGHGLALSRGGLTTFAFFQEAAFALVVTHDNRAVIGNHAEVFRNFALQVGPFRPWTAVAGNPYLVKDGQAILQPDPPSPQIAARTAIGLSASSIDGTPRYLYVLTIDGLEGRPRDPPYYGATYLDAAGWLIAAGCAEGFNLDGGGSTTMASISRTQDATLMNQPHDDEDSPTVSERAVAISLAVIVRQPA
jgi:Phosphodiester glycosidase